MPQYASVPSSPADWADAAVRLMSSGGDARITLDPQTGLNRYFSAPRPNATTAYASSTSNTISTAAFEHVVKRLVELAPGLQMTADAYCDALEGLRERIRAAYGLSPDVGIVFAPSGTDLEFVALAAASGRAGKSRGIHNILLGADEVGSGCIHSAHGRYFAEETALGITTHPGQPVPGLGDAWVDLTDIPVRDADGVAHPSKRIRKMMTAAIEAARAVNRHALVHVVHGSKTGLILPHLEDIDALRAEAGNELTLVVDACQARVTGEALTDYLKREAVVFITGSKFMGGPPFSGFALLPPGIKASTRLVSGFSSLFRRAEWPQDCPGAPSLPAEANLGLLLRLEASIFELERFQALPADTINRVIDHFSSAVASLCDMTGASRVASMPDEDRELVTSHPIEAMTLATLDFSDGANAPDFDEARRRHKLLLDDLSHLGKTDQEKTAGARAFRLGQPVKCVKLPDGRWGATLRLGMSMPQIVGWASMSDEALAALLARDMRDIALKLQLIERA